MSKRKRFEEEDEEEYEPTGSEEEYSDSEKLLLEKVRQGRRRNEEDSEEEVFGLGGRDSSDEGQGMSESDIEGKGEDEDDLPDVKAWGKKKRDYYSTDYVDQDYGGYDEKDVEAAEQEEEEARAIQKRLIEQLDDEDFGLEMFSKKPAQKETEVQEVIKTDLNKMSKRQRLDLLKKESPEFFGLVEDYKTNMREAQDRLFPVLKLLREDSNAKTYVRTKFHAILNYCNNILFYLLLKTKRIPVQSHPVVKRLFQFRQLLRQLEPVDEVMQPQVETILNSSSAVETRTKNRKQKKEKKKLKLLMNLEEGEEPKQEAEPVVTSKQNVYSEEEEGDEDLDEETKEVKEEEGGKRAITYQIAKNKGLTPYRKKENRNPRVKHRNKFRKAKVRRKGQIREPRKEVKKYGGEISGIKIGVVKSIKLK